MFHAHCYRADEILMLIRVADEMGFKIRTFQHVLEGYKVAKEIAAHGWWALDVQRLVGVQGGSVRRNAVQRRHHAQERRAGLSKFGFRRAHSTPEQRGGEDDKVRRADRRRSAGDW
jgi:hypothetical protein